MASSAMGDLSETRVSEWLNACTEALERAETWNPVSTSKRGARVYAGRFPNQTVLSYMWVQTLTDDEDNNVWNKLIEMFHGERVAEHAPHWDRTFREGHTLKHIPNLCDGADVVHWVFNAKLLWQRDLLFLNIMKRSEDGNQILFAYPSISDDDARRNYEVDLHERHTYEASHAGSKPVRKMRATRVRSENLLPTCDRITRLGNGKIRVEHVTTTAIKGWVPTVAWNTVLRGPIVAAHKREADLFRNHVEAVAHLRSGASSSIILTPSVEDDAIPHPSQFVSS